MFFYLPQLMDSAECSQNLMKLQSIINTHNKNASIIEKQKKFQQYYVKNNTLLLILQNSKSERQFFEMEIGNSFFIFITTYY